MSKKPKFKVGDITRYFNNSVNTNLVHKITEVNEIGGYYMLNTRHVGSSKYHNIGITYSIEPYDESEVLYERKIADTKLSRALYPDAEERAGYLILKGEV